MGSLLHIVMRNPVVLLAKFKASFEASTFSVLKWMEVGVVVLVLVWKVLVIVTIFSINIIIFLRCGPCQRIAPHFELLPSKYPKAIFLKVDVDKCQDTAAGQGVSAMPTFIFYKNRVSNAPWSSGGLLFSAVKGI